MLETIRQYAREKLWEAGGDESIRTRHLDYFVKLAKRAEPELHSFDQVLWLNRLHDELDNIRMAMEWSLAADVESGLSLLTVPIPFWFLRSTAREVEDWLERLLSQYSASTPLRAKALAIQSQCIVENGNFEEARRLAEESLELARAINDTQSEAFSLLSLGKVVSQQGSMESGEAFVYESLALYKSLEDKIGQANAIGWLCFNHNDIRRSLDFAREALRLSREIGDVNGVAYYLSAVARRMIWSGDLSPYVLDRLQEAKTIYEQIGNQGGAADILNGFGELAYWQGDYEKARLFFEEGVALSEQLGSSFAELWARVRLSYVILRQGDLVQARHMFRNVIERFQEADNQTGLFFAVEGMASLNVRAGQFEHAAVLFSWADAMREKIDHLRPPIDQASIERDLAIVHSQLNDSAFASLIAKGRTLSVTDAVTLALKE
jgi:tetratricopeptide (TPR) repeat protein